MRRLLGGRASHVDQAPALVTPASAAAAGAGARAGAGGEQASNASFDANMVIILAALLCVLICALGLNSVIRCAIHCARRLAPPPSGATTAAATARPAPSVTAGLKKKALSRIPVEVYGPKAGVPATECAICLGDFADGEKVRVLPRCHHGFHVRCIDMWLATHSSCPTCRDSLLEEGVAAAAAQGRQRAAGQYNVTAS